MNPDTDGTGTPGVPTHGPALPLVDRDPHEGELFTTELCFLMLTDAQRRDHGHRLGMVAAGERRRIRYVTWELEARALGVAFLSPPEPGWHRWRYYLARLMSDTELHEERRVAYDRLLRATTHAAMSFAGFEHLLEHGPGPARPP